LGALCEEGWLRHLHDSADRGVVRVEATAEGIALYGRGRPEPRFVAPLQQPRDLRVAAENRRKTLIARHFPSFP